MTTTINTKSIIKGSTVLLTALAWNSAIKGILDKVYPNDRDNARGFLRYAIIITIITIIIIEIFNYFNKHIIPHNNTYTIEIINVGNKKKIFRKSFFT